MSVFADKKFESLDWISQATEPLESELNVLLGSLPDVVEIDFLTYKDYIGESWSLDLNVNSIVNTLIRPKTTQSLSWDSRSELTKCFILQIEGRPIIDFETATISNGCIKLVKTISSLEEVTLKNLLGKEGINEVYSMYVPTHGLSRANEIMELLCHCEEGISSRSPRIKRKHITKRLKDIFKNNEWNIRDVELANKVGAWIADYIANGNLSALSNFCKLKVMTHKGNPIYSIEEVV